MHRNSINLMQDSQMVIQCHYLAPIYSPFRKLNRCFKPKCSKFYWEIVTSKSNRRSNCSRKISVALGFNWIIVILWIQNHRNLRWLLLDLIIQQFACFKHSIPTISKERANFLKCFAATNRRKRHSNINQFRLSNYIDSIIIRNFHSHTDDWFIKMNSRCYDEVCYHMPYAQFGIQTPRSKWNFPQTIDSFRLHISSFL